MNYKTDALVTDLATAMLAELGNDAGIIGAALLGKVI